MTASRNRYTPTAVLLHWFMAAAIFFQLALGWRMEDLPKGPAVFALFQLHKSIGFALLALVVLRLAWRRRHAPPALPEQMPVWEKQVAGLAHVALYLVMFGLPLTGWVLVSTSRTPIPTLLFGAVPVPHLPWLTELAPATRQLWHDGAGAAHGLLAVLMLALLIMHVGAVLKHQLLAKDAVFGHMAPGARPGWAEPRLWVLLAAAGAVFAAGFFYPRLPDSPGGAESGEAALIVQAPEQVPAMGVIPEAVAAVPDTAVSEAAPTVPVAAAVEKPVPETAAEPVRWKVGAGSALGFSTSWSGVAVEGRFPRWTADIRFSPEALEQSALTVNVQLGSVASDDAQRDEALLGEEWFNAAQFPQAVFKATGFERTGDDRYRAKGTLTLRGKTSPVTLDFSLRIRGDRAEAEGSALLDRTVFGVGQGEFAATDQIPAAVTVKFTVKAVKA